jgi:hypothetical protein
LVFRCVHSFTHSSRRMSISSLVKSSI